MTYRWRKWRKEIEGKQKDLRPPLSPSKRGVTYHDSTLWRRQLFWLCIILTVTPPSNEHNTSHKYQNTGHMVTITQSHAKGLQPCRTGGMVENGLSTRWHFLGTQLLALHADRKTMFWECAKQVFRCPQDTRMHVCHCTWQISTPLVSLSGVPCLLYMHTTSGQKLGGEGEGGRDLWGCPASFPVLLSQLSSTMSFILQAMIAVVEMRLG